MKISNIILFSFFIPLFCISQTITGRVIDKVTQQPVETAAVYFDNTTLGTTTNSNGEFSISYTEAIQSTLVVSYLGYDKVLISDYRTQNNINIELVEADYTLDEVYLNYEDGLTRRQKLRLFRKEFLGASKFGKSCKILNEEDLVLRYSKENKTLYASSKIPLTIINKRLQYEVAFDIVDFEINFRYVEAKTNNFSVRKVAFFGTSYYKNLKNAGKNKIIKSRAQAFKGSVQHFMRSLYYETLREEGYWIFHDKFRVEEWDFFKVETVADSKFKKVQLEKTVNILFNKKLQSKLELEVKEFFVDNYGYYTPIIGLYFSGFMGNQRVGDSLPLDYGITEKK